MTALWVITVFKVELCQHINASLIGRFDRQFALLSPQRSLNQLPGQTKTVGMVTLTSNAYQKSNWWAVIHPSFHSSPAVPHRGARYRRKREGNPDISLLGDIPQLVLGISQGFSWLKMVHSPSNTLWDGFSSSQLYIEILICHFQRENMCCVFYYWQSIDNTRNVLVVWADGKLDE